MNKKSVAIIYRLFKEGKLTKVTNQNIKRMYEIVDEYTYGHSYNINGIEYNTIINAISNAFSGNIESVNEAISLLV